MPDDNIPASMTGTSGTPTLPTVAPVSDAGTSVDPGVPPVDPGVPPLDTVTPSPVVDPVIPSDAPAPNAPAAPDTETPAEVAKKIGEAHNVLIALSSDPSVDEMAAAIGLSLYLDKLGKRATAIYSGQTPNALQFLKPEETFEDSVDTLQDFVIALNKEKADHLRYKLDGDYVKIFITPYKSRIAEEDLEFSYGDYNVDLVLALDVANGVDLDAALREHGRIMHDAVIIDITTGNPGKLGEIEWSDKKASSVSEMIAKLLYGVNSKAKIEKEEATAFLTGIVAATNRFANAGTTSETMRIASRLIDSGANQQLIAKNITPDIENEMLSMGNFGTLDGGGAASGDPTLLDIEHGNEEGVDESKIVDATVTEKESTLLDDLKAAEASLAAAGAEVTAEEGHEPLKIDSSEASTPADVAESIKNEDVTSEAPADTADNSLGGAPVLPEVKDDTETSDADEGSSESPEGPGGEGFISNQPEKVIQPSSDFESGLSAGVDDNKYGHMLEDALASVGGAVEPVAPVVSTPEVSPMMSAAPANPATTGAPTVPTNPEINGVPEINYMPLPGDAVLPPPPTPPIADAGSVPPVSMGDAGALPTVEPIQPAAPVVEPAPEPLGAQPAMQDQVYGPQAADPGAFKIPGM